MASKETYNNNEDFWTTAPKGKWFLPKTLFGQPFPTQQSVKHPMSYPTSTKSTQTRHQKDLTPRHSNTSTTSQTDHKLRSQSFSGFPIRKRVDVRRRAFQTKSVETQTQDVDLDDTGYHSHDSRSGSTAQNQTTSTQTPDENQEFNPNDLWDKEEFGDVIAYYPKDFFGYKLPSNVQKRQTRKENEKEKQNEKQSQDIDLDDTGYQSHDNSSKRYDHKKTTSTQTQYESQKFDANDLWDKEEFGDVIAYYPKDFFGYKLPSNIQTRQSQEDRQTQDDYRSTAPKDIWDTELMNGIEWHFPKTFFGLPFPSKTKRPNWSPRKSRKTNTQTRDQSEAFDPTGLWDKVELGGVVGFYPKDFFGYKLPSNVQTRHSQENRQTQTQDRSQEFDPNGLWNKEEFGGVIAYYPKDFFGYKLPSNVQTRQTQKQKEKQKQEEKQTQTQDIDLDDTGYQSHTDTSKRYDHKKTTSTQTQYERHRITKDSPQTKSKAMYNPNRPIPPRPLSPTLEIHYRVLPD